jgi:biopolymer transport protein TolR
MNAAQVRAKARMAMKRREEEIETEELEGGELNLVPYLDIVTNVMLFLLATVTSGLILGNINSALPEYAPSGTSTAGQTEPGEQDAPLEMTAFVAVDKITFYSNKGVEGYGTLDKPLLELPAIKPGKEYDFTKLTAAAQDVVNRRFKDRFPLAADPKDKSKFICVDDSEQGKPKPLPMTACRPPGASEVILVVDATIPYYIVTNTMDALRQNNDPAVTYPNNLLFPDPLFSTGIR